MIDALQRSAAHRRAAHRIAPPRFATHRTFFVMIFFLTAQPAAACHHYSIWKNPWPQRCAAVSNTKRVHFANRPARSTVQPDRSWYVEIGVPDDVAREQALDRLRELMRKR